MIEYVYISRGDGQNTAILSTLTDLPGGNQPPETIGAEILHFATLDSTNDHALRLLSVNRPKHGTIISTDYQTSGRGQIGRGWHSGPGLNLCLSYILYPAIKAYEQFQISMAVALGVSDTVSQQCGADRVRIKWPNDIYVDEKKIAGILIQNSIQATQITACVAGIGLNVNETDFPPELTNPTSLKLELGSNTLLDLVLIRNQLSTHLQKRLEQLGKNTLLQAQYQAMLYHKDVLSSFRLPDNEQLQSGMIAGVDPLGRLIVHWVTGKKGVYQHREIELV